MFSKFSIRPIVRKYLMCSKPDLKTPGLLFRNFSENGSPLYGHSKITRTNIRNVKEIRQISSLQSEGSGRKNHFKPKIITKTVVKSRQKARESKQLRDKNTSSRNKRKIKLSDILEPSHEKAERNASLAETDVKMLESEATSQRFSVVILPTKNDHFATSSYCPKNMFGDYISPEQLRQNQEKFEAFQVNKCKDTRILRVFAD